MPIDVNWNYFSITGYISVALWVCVPLLWLLHMKIRPRKWFCHMALIISIAALIFGLDNSKNYVNLIQLDRSEEMAKLQAENEAALLAAQKSRLNDVTQRRFAEDAAGDALDTAGMDDAELKYMDKMKEKATPEWMKIKKKRTAGSTDDDSVEVLIGSTEKAEGMESETTEQVQKKAPVLMVAADRDMASRLDGVNLKVIRVFILLSIIYIVTDYLRRANIYAEAYMPLPLPSSWLNGLTPLQTLVNRPEPVRRTIPEELAWLIKRGDSFVYLTDNSSAARRVPPTMPRLLKGICQVDILPVTEGEENISDDFIFESLWYGRSSFTVDSKERSVRVLKSFMKLMRQRKETRAKVEQTVHLVWDVDSKFSEDGLNKLKKLCYATGISLFMC